MIERRIKPALSCMVVLCALSAPSTVWASPPDRQETQICIDAQSNGVWQSPQHVKDDPNPTMLYQYRLARVIRSHGKQTVHANGSPIVADARSAHLCKLSGVYHILIKHELTTSKLNVEIDIKLDDDLIASRRHEFLTENIMTANAGPFGNQ